MKNIEILKCRKLDNYHSNDFFSELFARAKKSVVKTLTGIPPLTFTADGTPLIDYLISGNTTQNGTPTPDSPVMPQGTGERTGNLINVPALSDVRWATQYPVLLAAINSLPNGVYTMSISYELTSRNDTTDSSVCGWYIAKDSEALSNVRRRWETAQIGEITTVVDTFTIDDNNRGAFTSLYLYGCGINGVGATGTAIATNIMLNTGSTALPYEPYGVKIPISSGDTTTNIYLGEAETTRKIRKYEFTGDEDWFQSGAVSNTFYTVISGYLRQRRVIIAICSHYTSQANITGAAEMQDGNISFYANAGQPFEYFYVRDSNLSTVANLKTYLAQQYAAGTPVTVWYVLATEETAVVNEPLMRIGDYADTLSKTQAGVTIPTNNGSTTVDVDTTVKPSEVYLKYMG